MRPNLLVLRVRVLPVGRELEAGARRVAPRPEGAVSLAELLVASGIMLALTAAVGPVLVRAQFSFRVAARSGRHAAAPARGRRGVRPRPR